MYEIIILVCGWITAGACALGWYKADRALTKLIELVKEYKKLVNYIIENFSAKVDSIPMTPEAKEENDAEAAEEAKGEDLAIEQNA